MGDLPVTIRTIDESGGNAVSSLLHKIGVELPIIQAPMAGVSTPAMAAAVSNAGALGSIGVGNLNAAQAKEMILATQQLTDRPINVNVFCHQPAKLNAQRDEAWLRYLAPHFEKFESQPPKELREIYSSFIHDDEMLHLILQMSPRIVSFHFGLPSQEKIAALKGADIILLATATNLSEAQALENAGVDAIVAQGFEAGGHRGVFDPQALDLSLGISALTRLLVCNLNIPVIAAGGIMDGAGIASALHLGAAAAQLGTAFIDCPESAADAYYRAALKSPAALNTIMTSAISGRPARCLPNDFTALGEQANPAIISDYPLAYDAGKALNECAKRRGHGGYGAQWAGQGAPLSRSLPAAELIATLKREMDEAFRRQPSSY